MAGYRAQTDEWVFSGAVFNRLDTDVYLASMQAGAAGHWAYRLRFTSEPHPGIYAKLTYVLLGHAARASGLSVPVAYQVFRLLFGLLACLAIYALMAQVFTGLFWRRLAFLWAVLGSGLGWLQLAAGWLPRPDISPIDFWLHDPYPYFGILAAPHFSLITALLAGMLASFLSWLRRPRGWKIVSVALLGVLLQFLQSYAPLLADLALLGTGVAVMIRQRRIVWRVVYALGIVGLTQMPLLVYGMRVFLRDSLWSEFVRQNVTLSPPPVYFLWGFALLWPPALVGAWRALRGCFRLPGQRDGNPPPDAQDDNPAGLAAVMWVVGALILAYLPWNLQRRFTHALMLPLSMLAVMGLLDWERRSRLAARRGAMSLLGLSAISSLYLTFGFSLLLFTRPPDRFDPASVVAAAGWVGAHVAADDVVLSAPHSGQVLAARGGVVVYIGHPIETLHYDEKTALVTAFYRGEVSLIDLPACGCDWLLVGPYERALNGGAAFIPPPGAEPVYRNAEVIVYRLEDR